MTYSASSDVGIGTGGVAGQALPGYAQAVQTLAENYSQMVRTPELLTSLSKKTGIASVELSDRLAATRIPDSSVIRLSVAASSETDAVKLANVVSISFARIIGERAGAGADPISINDIRGARYRLFRSQQALAELRAEGVSSASDRYLRARAAVAARQIHVRTLSQRYEQARSTPDALTTEVLRPAVMATSDARKRLVTYGMCGLLFGLTLSFALVITRGRQR
ncbi:MAG: hypothetical protein QM679_01265 [Patulibacter sp.]